MIIVKHVGSHTVDTIALYFALHSKYCNGGLMMVFIPKHTAIFKYGEGVVFDGYITGSSECLINTIGCPPLN
jgi:hypothetical protein